MSTPLRSSASPSISSSRTRPTSSARPGRARRAGPRSTFSALASIKRDTKSLSMMSSARTRCFRARSPRRLRRGTGCGSPCPAPRARSAVCLTHRGASRHLQRRPRPRAECSGGWRRCGRGDDFDAYGEFFVVFSLFSFSVKLRNNLQNFCAAYFDACMFITHVVGIFIANSCIIKQGVAEPHDQNHCHFMCF